MTKPKPVADDPAAQALILEADTSKRGWQRRAVGTTKEAALAEIHRVGVLQGRFPIGPLRVLQAHIAAQNVDQSAWIREAAIAHYLRQGGDIDVAVALNQIERHARHRRDVPRDQYGQARTL